MRSLIIGFLFFVPLVWLGLLFLSPSVASDSHRTNENQEYVYQITKSSAVLGVAAYIVMDEITGEVLLEHNAENMLPIASVVKLIVAGALLSTDILVATTTITETDVTAPEDFGSLAAGEVYTANELLYPYLLESSNDAGSALERRWSTDIGPMLEQLLLETDTTDSVAINDYNGLRHDTAASPRALATIVRYLVQKHPHVFDITQLPYYVGRYAPLANNSPFVDYAGYSGGKHGYTPEAGRTYIARIMTDFADGPRPLLYVVLGAEEHLVTQRSLESLLQTTVTRELRRDATSGILSPSSNETSP